MLAVGVFEVVVFVVTAEIGYRSVLVGGVAGLAAKLVREGAGFFVLGCKTTKGSRTIPRSEVEDAEDALYLVGRAVREKKGKVGVEGVGFWGGGDDIGGLRVSGERLQIGNWMGGRNRRSAMGNVRYLEGKGKAGN